MTALPTLEKLRPWRVRGGIALALIAAAAAFFLVKKERANPLVSTPLLAVEAAPGGSLYFNGEAHRWLKTLRRDLLDAETLDERGERVRAFAQAVQNPKLFRQLDRQWRFDALLLVGNPGEYRPLLDHLLETKDFAPVYVDHWAIVFRRGAQRPWELADFAAVRGRLATLSKRERAECFAEAGVKLVALRHMADARALLDEARQLDADSPQAWNGEALVHMQNGEWKAALACADRALAGRLEPLYALATKTQVLYATKHFSEAYTLSRRLVAGLPDDPAILFKHAQICHEAHAYREEIKALEKLIARAEAEQRPVAGYQIYLGQACAAASEAERAIAAFTKALADPELPEDQRDFARENIARIKSRTEGE